MANRKVIFKSVNKVGMMKLYQT